MGEFEKRLMPLAGQSPTRMNLVTVREVLNLIAEARKEFPDKSYFSDDMEAAMTKILRWRVKWFGDA